MKVGNDEEKKKIDERNPNANWVVFIIMRLSQYNDAFRMIGSC